MLTIHRKTIFDENKNWSDYHDWSEKQQNIITSSKHYISDHKDHKILEENIYYNEMKPIFLLMRLLGRFPYSFTKTGFAPFTFFSWSFLYCLVFNVGFVLMKTWSIRTIINEKVHPSESYDEKLFWCLLILYACQSFTGPITFWWDAPKTIRYFKKWKDFERIWKCGSIYSAKRIKLIRIFTASSTPLIMVIVIYEALTLPKIPALVFLPYTPILLSAVLMLEHWWMTLHDLNLYSDKLLASIFEVKSGHTMGQRRRLWLKISELATELGRATGCSGLSFSGTFFAGFLLSAYAILISYASPGSSQVSSWALYVPAVYSAVSYYVAAEAAYRATQRIGPMFAKKFLQIDVKFLPQSCLNEVELFVNSLSVNAPVIEYLGFMKVSRNTFVHFMSTTVTYLVVLAQMKYEPHELRINSDYNSTSYENLTSQN